MFAYCGNNPANRLDITGVSWLEVWEAFKEAYNSASANANVIYVGAGAFSQLDSPAPGPADLVALGAAGLAFFGCVAYATYDVVTQYVPAQTFEKKQTQTQAKKQSGPNYQYWEAWRDKAGVHVGRGLTFTEAAIRVACGFDLMCANQAAAVWILIVNGYWNSVGPETHGGIGYYEHYHPHRKTHTHIWYYGG